MPSLPITTVDRMMTVTYDVLDLLIEAKFSRSKKALLVRANLLLERLRFQVRLCMDERFISVKQYAHVVGLIHEVGSMVGGWVKSVKE